MLDLIIAIFQPEYPRISNVKVDMSDSESLDDILNACWKCHGYIPSEPHSVYYGRCESCFLKSKANTMELDCVICHGPIYRETVYGLPRLVIKTLANTKDFLDVRGRCNKCTNKGS
jgi:hypothetical protein